MSDTNNIEDLRSALFATLKGVREGTLPLDRARAVNEIAQSLIATAKVEVEFLKVTNGEKSEFINPPKELPAGVTQHRLGG